MRPLIFLSIMSTFAFSPKEGFGHSLIIVDDYSISNKSILMKILADYWETFPVLLLDFINKKIFF